MESFYVLQVPSAEFLGTGETDFSNVASVQIDLDGNVIADTPKLAFFCGGRLGTLKGGLLHLEDVRHLLTREEIQNMAVEQTVEHLENKRTGNAKIRAGVTMFYVN